MSAAPEQAGFPKVHSVLKWVVIGALAILAVAAAVFWAMILGQFSASGFHAAKGSGNAGESIAVTPECAWPYTVHDHEAEAVCRLFYNMTPEQRAQALRARERGAAR